MHEFVVCCLSGTGTSMGEHSPYKSELEVSLPNQVLCVVQIARPPPSPSNAPSWH